MHEQETTSTGSVNPVEATIRHVLDSGDATSEILIAPDLLLQEETLSPWRRWLADRMVFVVSTQHILELHGDRLRGLLGEAKQRVDLLVEDGEGAKSLGTAGRLWQDMLVAGGKRDSRLVTFGGGTVGDLGGFVAGSFLRGIDYLQVPTTLLAQVDASIGGKTAIDMPALKNSVGLFHHPAAVLADTSVLSTLPPGELRSGLMEAVKKGMVLDGELLQRIDGALPQLLEGDRLALGPVVAAAAIAKSRVVEADAKEGGWRRILNFGHTLGHAIETELQYQHLRHGEAVAYGMLFALGLATSRGLPREDADVLRNLLGRCALPALPPLDTAPLLAYMARDKKATEQGLTWVLPTALGHGDMFDDVTRQEVASRLPGFLEDPWSAAS